MSENGRTHEPSLREVTTELDGFRNLMDERDRRYDQRFEAMDEKTSLALTSSEKAVSKAEAATEKRFDAVNEFRGQLKDQAATLMPRAEADSKFKTLEDKLEEMKRGSTVQTRWTMDKVLMLGVALIGWAILLFRGKP